MNSDSVPFDSPKHLTSAFSQGLHQMLDNEQGMGAFILVLANAMSDPALYDDLGDKLHRRFTLLEDSCRRLLDAGSSPQEPADDLMVFLELMAVGYDRLAHPRLRREDIWQLQFNMLRSFRPERAGGERISSLVKPFNPDTFHFNKPFLAPETFWRGTFLGKTTALLYNKFPFMSLHGLWVPEPEAGMPQFLEQGFHHYAWQSCRQLGERIPGLGLAFNSLGAGSSVNHLHFQLFVSPESLPIEHERWSHNGGALSYPLECRQFDDPDSAWNAIAHCHDENIAYNILYRGSSCILIRRRFQGDFERQQWLSAMTWSELCGSFVLFNREHFLQLNSAEIESQLAVLNC